MNTTASPTTAAHSSAANLAEQSSAEATVGEPPAADTLTSPSTTDTATSTSATGTATPPSATSTAPQSPATDAAEQSSATAVDTTTQSSAADTAGNSTASRKLPVIHGEVTLSQALDEENNMLLRLNYPEQRLDFFTWIYTHRPELQAAVSHHLGLVSDEICEIGDVRKWIHGSFNVSIPVNIENWRRHPGRRVMLRLPLPYKTGEASFPGNNEEKRRTEAATTIWLQQHCPDVPIPLFWGFGLAHGQCFLRVEAAPFLSRLRWHIWSITARLLGQELPHPYVLSRRRNDLEHGYMISDFVEQSDGEMLESSWKERRGDKELRKNLFQGLARIILSVSRIPQPRIGAWTIDNRGKLSLSNRPLLHQFHAAENEGIETRIPRDQVYTTADSFYSDLLNLHDNRIRSQPNAIVSKADGEGQMANLFAMRGLIPQFTPRRNGPFVVQLTDIHGPNVFVDSRWNIKAIVDLEWTASLPIEMSGPPYWLTGRGIDQLTDDDLTDYERVLEEFFTAFEDEERLCRPAYSSPTYRTDILRQAWSNRTTFFTWALCSLSGCYNVFRQNIQPKYASGAEIEGFSGIVTPYWEPDARRLIQKKLHDLESYNQQVARRFEDN